MDSIYMAYALANGDKIKMKKILSCVGITADEANDEVLQLALADLQVSGRPSPGFCRCYSRDRNNCRCNPPQTVNVEVVCNVVHSAPVEKRGCYEEILRRQYLGNEEKLEAEERARQECSYASDLILILMNLPSLAKFSQDVVSIIADYSLAQVKLVMKMHISRDESLENGFGKEKIKHPKKEYRKLPSSMDSGDIPFVNFGGALNDESMYDV